MHHHHPGFFCRRFYKHNYKKKSFIQPLNNSHYLYKYGMVRPMAM